MKIEKIINRKKYVRKIKGMGKGLVLFEISSVDKRIGQNYHFFYENKCKPPLDIAVNPDDRTIEYISYFIQDEKIKSASVIPSTQNKNMRIKISDKMFNEGNMNIMINGNFKALKFENEIYILRDDMKEEVLNTYEIDDSNSLLFFDNEFIGIVFKNLIAEEIQEIYDSKCIL